jgi:nicotinamidase-related amidase
MPDDPPVFTGGFFVINILLFYVLCHYNVMARVISFLLIDRNKQGGFFMASSNGKLEFLTDKNSMLALIDYQPSMFKGVGSGDKTIIRNAAYCAAKAAQILNIPTVFSTINPKFNGEFIEDIAKLFPGQEIFARKVPSFDAFEDDRNWNAVKKTGRPKLVISGLWTSMCFCYSAMHAVKEGMEVYGLVDAAGDSTKIAHDCGIQRMLQVGVVPITVESLVSEWMHDWSNPKSGDLVNEVYSRYGYMIGIK